MPYQTAKDMIDTTALTALITAFRAEVTQNSISPEKVGSILQQIADLLATAAPDSDMSELTVLRRVKINFSSRLLVALTTLRVLEPAHARQSKINFSSALAYSQVWLILLKKQPRLMYDICILYIFAK